MTVANNLSSEEIQQLVLNELDAHSQVPDTGKHALLGSQEYTAVRGALASLEAKEMVAFKPINVENWVLSAEGQQMLDAGKSYEASLFELVPAGATGIPMDEAKKTLGDKTFSLAQMRCFKQKWLSKSGASLIRSVESIVDQTLLDLVQVSKRGNLEGPSANDTIKELKKRQLIEKSTIITFKVEKGLKFSTKIEKEETDLTSEMIASGSYKKTTFKKFNFNALGLPPTCGHLHPLLKVRAEFRQIFFDLGFTEMPTNQFVESSFWNFDALFQPQQHPARDMHDTFFLLDPATDNNWRDKEYLERVKKVHSEGGYGSIGYGYDWKEEEAEKLLLRTHTTAVSSCMLYKLAQEKPFRPVKYFSIDRVFRNESVDATHLAEFHQVEGLVADVGLTLGDLIGVLHGFFKKLGIKKLRFKPAYNPYTEPSMEIFSYHEGLKRWVEIGNSGMFRPEMLEPMGLPSNVSVIAWGLSLERPTMIKYGIDNIRELVGHKLDLDMVKKNPVCRLDKKMGREN